MESTLAMVMILAIFVGIPAVIGGAIAGAYALTDLRARRAERTRALGQAIEGLQEQPVWAK